MGRGASAAGSPLGAQSATTGSSTSGVDLSATAGSAAELAPVRKRRIVTIADLPGHKATSEAAGDGAPLDKQEDKAASPSSREGARRSDAPVTALPAKTRAELRVYLTELLSNQPVRERQRLLLELLLDELKASPVTYKYADLRTRLAVLSGQKLGCSTAAIAERVFGENSKRTRSRVEALLADGVDLDIVDQLLALTAKH
jgi:hypothetical protein